jgi:hypothetical protein
VRHALNAIGKSSTAEGNFCKAKDKERGAGKRSSRYQSCQGDKYAIPDSARGRIDNDPLCADHRRLFMLCWAARASDAPPALLNDRARFAHVNGYELSLKSRVLVRFDHVVSVIEKADRGFELRFHLVDYALSRELNGNFKCR